MPIFEIEIKNLKELRQAFRDYPKISEPILQKAVMGTAALLAKHRTRATVPWRTGRLLQSFIPRFARLQMRYMPTVNYAIFVHEGTRPHTILPRFKKALYWAGAAHPVKKVNHPGTKGRRFLQEIADRAKPEIDNFFLSAVNKINLEIARRTNAF